VAAAPHTNRMVVPGRALPAHTLPRVGGVGKPGFPTPLRTGCARTFPGAGAWVRGPPARIRKARGNPVSPLPASPRWGEAPGSRPQRGRVREGAVCVGGLCPPRPSRRVSGRGNLVSPAPCARVAPAPSRGRGRGCAGLRPASARRGETRFSPSQSPPSGGRLGGGLNPAHDGHRSRPCGSAAPRRNEHTVVPGRAAPSQTLPRVGAWGNPGSPCPSSRAYVHVRRQLCP